jgi:hypothetical protein
MFHFRCSTLIRALWLHPFPDLHEIWSNSKRLSNMRNTIPNDLVHNRYNISLYMQIESKARYAPPLRHLVHVNPILPRIHSQLNILLDISWRKHYEESDEYLWLYRIVIQCRTQCCSVDTLLLGSFRPFTLRSRGREFKCTKMNSGVIATNKPSTSLGFIFFILLIFLFTVLPVYLEVRTVKAAVAKEGRIVGRDGSTPPPPSSVKQSKCLYCFTRVVLNSPLVLAAASFRCQCLRRCTWIVKEDGMCVCVCRRIYIQLLEGGLQHNWVRVRESQ